ncbi:serine hydrolase domain-containing protein [Pseudoalteromonas luteoviolacea]|uniref:Beta-lactamase-related domain-containing protein n=1 Tax=Pseudoalteromonas luteoviolacea H33 TaxID=1365251 RepID=A0A167DW10_9GAMM|nr:serine hydrolase domain-containing protein [Pseudoalteromonas luteoviolacea]KZN49440.1 hypothetical protein N476_19330 [Pseudoalteromonas luteoviolacea H33]KZN72627.1 hypothetical protein N477_24850 [Pseudoalteromonas luteoviolacea H33-S]MBQ4876262.1 beta-lactamase family protein [Pseudoalteromonas luteoviolacea]MBQ4906296.1 beta-lactamase family protein [Pseudoalteromonas luteoviolacea]
MGKKAQAILFLSLIGVSQLSYAVTPQQAAEKLKQFIEDVPSLEPGYAVVAVTKNEVLLNHVQGIRNIDTQLPLTLDTPIYIASQTKAYMGLLAAKLDKQGILKLNDTIAKHWPHIKLPEGVDPNHWTLSDLLTHQFPVEADRITTLEAYMTEVDHKDYPALLAKHSVKRDEGFDYTNLGYNIYGAILHKVTGKAWQDWLQDEIFTPMAMVNTSARTSDFSMKHLSWNHIWQGEEKGWHIVPPKTDGKMQSAGGLVASPRDMGKWLQLQLNRELARKSGFSSDMMKLAHTSVAQLDPKARNPYELPCHGYALGWTVCDIDGHTVYTHGGGYTGARTVMAFSPDLGVGIGVFSNSDNMTGWLSRKTMVQFFQYLTAHEKADEMAEQRQGDYPERVQWLLDRRQQRQADGINALVKQSGVDDYQPTKAELVKLVGNYQGQDKYSKLAISMSSHGVLTGQLYDYEFTIQPISMNLFAERSSPFSKIRPINIKFDNNSKQVKSLTWFGTEYVKISD